MAKLEQLIQKLGQDRVFLDEPLSKYTNWRTGGPAEILYICEGSDELINAVSLAKALEIDYLVLGLGANVLVSDMGVSGLAIINRSDKIKFLPHGFLEAESGVNLNLLIQKSVERRLSGLERMIRVPGTVGGAIYMNAGDTGSHEFFGNLVRSVTVLDRAGSIKKLDQAESKFSYRKSRFQESGEIILSSLLQLLPSTKEDIEKKVADILMRKRNQPSGPSAGSTFKNPPGNYAGKLIEGVGLKGIQIGAAKFSETHANFIINTGNATSSDIKALINLAKNKIKEKFGFDLEEEIHYIGDW